MKTLAAQSRSRLARLSGTAARRAHATPLGWALLCLPFGTVTLVPARAWQSPTPIAQPKPSQASAPSAPPRSPAVLPVVPFQPAASATGTPRAGAPAVQLRNGALTVQANGSDLPQILREVAQVSGMTINGSINSSRVFGTYGPSNPREVLTDLLSGTGYNFMMYGVTRDGAPRELLLTLQQGGPTKPSASAATATASPDGTPGSIGNGALSTSRPTDPRSADNQPELGPGAIGDVPPEPPEDDVERAKQSMDRLRKIQKIQNGESPQ